MESLVQVFIDELGLVFDLNRNHCRESCFMVTCSQCYVQSHCTRTQKRRLIWSQEVEGSFFCFITQLLNLISLHLWILWHYLHRLITFCVLVQYTRKFKVTAEHVKWMSGSYRPPTEYFFSVIFPQILVGMFVQNFCVLSRNIVSHWYFKQKPLFLNTREPLV